MRIFFSIIIFSFVNLMSVYVYAQIFTLDDFQRLEFSANNTISLDSTKYNAPALQLHKAFIAEKKGDLKKASNLFHALYVEHNEELSEKAKSKLLFKLSAVNYHLKAPHIALGYLDKIESFNVISKYDILEQKAICYSDLSEIDSSIFYFKEALRLSEDFSDSIKNMHNLSAMAFNNGLDKQYNKDLLWIIESKDRANSNLDSIIIANTYLVLLEKSFKVEDYNAMEEYVSQFKRFIQNDNSYRNEYHLYHLNLFDYLIAKKQGNNALALKDGKELQQASLPGFAVNRIKYRLYLLLFKTNYSSISNLSNEKIIDSMNHYKEKIEESDIQNINNISNQFTSSLKENLSLTEDQLQNKNEKNAALEKANGLYLIMIILLVALTSVILYVIYYSFRAYKKRQDQLKIIYEKDKSLSASEIDKQKLEASIREQKIKQRESDIVHLQELMDSKSQVTKDIISKLNLLKDSIIPEERDKISSFMLSLKGYEGAKEEMISLNQNKDESFSREFQQSLKDKHPNLSDSEIKLASLIYLGIDSKRISQIRNVSPESIRTFKYRIKKKIGLDKETNLEVYLKKEIV